MLVIWLCDVLGALQLTDIECLIPHLAPIRHSAHPSLVEGGLKITWRALGWKALIGEFAPETLGAELVEQEATA